jgi:hypothetical protein
MKKLIEEQKEKERQLVVDPCPPCMVPVPQLVYITNVRRCYRFISELALDNMKLSKSLARWLNLILARLHVVVNCLVVTTLVLRCAIRLLIHQMR